VQSKNIITYGIFIVALVIAFAYKLFTSKSGSYLYPNFGIRIPAGYNTHGIDVSRYQEKIDWNLVSQMEDRGQRLSFVIIKATEGTNLKDPYFERNWKETKKHELLRGAYLYFHPGKSPREQAEYFIKQVPKVSGDMAPVIDIEETNRKPKEAIKESLKVCANILENHYGVKPIIYSNVDFYTQYLSPDFDIYPFWAAHYLQSSAPRIGRDWLIWQHSDKGRVNGISARVDFNVVNGTLNRLKQYCIP
jgi:Lyzozyme M1 (1,4-beta-N-acetylmuramidase)